MEKARTLLRESLSKVFAFGDGNRDDQFRVRLLFFFMPAAMPPCFMMVRLLLRLLRGRCARP